MHAGRSLACGSPAELVKERHAATLEEAFIGYLSDADPASKSASAEKVAIFSETKKEPSGWQRFFNSFFSIQRWYSCCWRETLELMRDPIRLILALFGAILLMVVMGYGISMDVEDLSFAVLDRDQSELSRNYTLNIAGSRYFIEQAPVRDYYDLDEWMSNYLKTRLGTSATAPASLETRYRYNPDVLSLPAMVPAVIPLLLMMIPAILAALAVVREKEMGSIINLYVTPLTRVEFLLGKQLPYVILSMFSASLLLLMAVVLFHVPIKGSLPLMLFSLFLYCTISTGMGLLASSATRSQIAVIFLTMIGTLLPAVQFCGLLNPVTTLTGFGRFIGMIYPTSYMLVISRGVFNKALNFSDLHMYLLALVIMIPVIFFFGTILLKKQETN